MGYHLRRKGLAFDAGHGQNGLQLCAQAADALLDHPLHPGRQSGPINRLALDPITVLVLTQIAPLCHLPQ